MRDVRGMRAAIYTARRIYLLDELRFLEKAVDMLNTDNLVELGDLIRRRHEDCREEVEN